MIPRTIEELFKIIMTGGDPGTESLLFFCKNASDEQLRDVCRRDNTISIHNSQDRQLFHEEIEHRKQLKLEKHLKELKEPHKLLWWTFRVSLAALGVGILALILNYLQWQFPRQPVADANTHPIPQLSEVGHQPDLVPKSEKADLLQPIKAPPPAPTTNAATTLPP